MAIVIHPSNQLGRDVIGAYVGMARLNAAITEASRLPTTEDTIADFVTTEGLNRSTYKGASLEEKQVFYGTVLGAYFGEQFYEELREKQIQCKQEIRAMLGGLAGRTAYVQTKPGYNPIPVRRRSKVDEGRQPYTVIDEVSAVKAKFGHAPYDAKTGGLRLELRNRVFRAHRHVLVPVVDDSGTPLIHLAID